MPTRKHVITFLADDDLLKRIDDYRRSQDSIPSRSEAVRLLVENSLGLLETVKPKSKKK